MILQQSVEKQLFIANYQLSIVNYFLPLHQQSLKLLEQCTKMYLITLYEMQRLR